MEVLDTSHMPHNLSSHRPLCLGGITLGPCILVPEAAGGVHSTSIPVHVRMSLRLPTQSGSGLCGLAPAESRRFSAQRREEQD